MAESSFPWTDSTGDGGTYSQDALRAVWEALLHSIADDWAVLPGRRDELFPYSTGDNNVSIAAGAAVVDGTIYNSTAVVSNTVTSPSVGTTGKRIVLQKDWTAQTIRIVEITSADGTATIPSLTQTDGVTWEEPICSFTITTAGVIGALTDERVWPGGITQPTHPELARARGHRIITDAEPAVATGYSIEGTDYYQQGVPVGQGLVGRGYGNTTIGLLFALNAAKQGLNIQLATSSDYGWLGTFVDRAAPSTTPTLALPFEYDVLPIYWGALLTPEQSFAGSSTAHQEWGLIGDIQASAVPITDYGAYFKQEENGNLIAVTRTSGGVETTTSLGAISGFSTQTWFEIIALNIGGADRYFFLAGREIVAMHTTNLPDADMGHVIGGWGGTDTNRSIDDIESVYASRAAA